MIVVVVVVVASHYYYFHYSLFLLHQLILPHLISPNKRKEKYSKTNYSIKRRRGNTQFTLLTLNLPIFSDSLRSFPSSRLCICKRELESIISKEVDAEVVEVVEEEEEEEGRFEVVVVVAVVVVVIVVVWFVVWVIELLFWLFSPSELTYQRKKLRKKLRKKEKEIKISYIFNFKSSLR